MNARLLLQLAPLGSLFGCGSMGLDVYAGADSGGVGATFEMQPSSVVEFGVVDVEGSHPAQQTATLIATGDEAVAILAGEIVGSQVFSVPALPVPHRVQPAKEFPITLEFLPIAGGPASGAQLVLDVESKDGTIVQAVWDLTGEGCRSSEGTCPDR